MRAIVFDLDGTLVDSAPDIANAANKMLVGEGHAPLDLAQIITFIGNGLPKLVERCMEARGIDLAEHARLTEVTLAHYNAASTDLTAPYPNVMAVLEALSGAGFALAVCTNKPEAPARDILQGLGMDHFFDHVIGGDTLPQRKPDPEPLLETFRRMGAEAGLYVGDSDVDAETAANAGIRFALFSEGYSRVPVAELPHDFLFSDFRMLEQIAEKVFGVAV